MTVIIALLLCTALSMQCAAPEAIARRENADQASDQNDNHEDNNYPGLNEFLHRKGKRVKQPFNLTHMNDYEPTVYKTLHGDRLLVIAFKSKKDEHGKKIDKSSYKPVCFYDTYRNEELQGFGMIRDSHDRNIASHHPKTILFETRPHGLTTSRIVAENPWPSNSDDFSRQVGPGQIDNPNTTFSADGSRFFILGAPSPTPFGPKYHCHNVIVRDAKAIHEKTPRNIAPIVAILKCNKRYFNPNYLCTNKERMLSYDGTRLLAYAQQSDQIYNKDYPSFIFEQFNVDTKQKEFCIEGKGQNIGHLWDARTGQDLYVVTDEEHGEMLHHYQNGLSIHKILLQDNGNKAEDAVQQKTHLAHAYGKKILVWLAWRGSLNGALFLYDANNRNLQILIDACNFLGDDDSAIDPMHRYFAIKTGSKEITVVDAQDGKAEPIELKYPISSVQTIAGTHYARIICKLKHRHYYYLDLQTGKRASEEDIPTVGVTCNVLEHVDNTGYIMTPHVNPKYHKERMDLMYRAMQHKKATKQALDVAGNQQDAAIFDTLPVFLKACDNIIRNQKGN